MAGCCFDSGVVRMMPFGERRRGSGSSERQRMTWLHQWIFRSHWGIDGEWWCFGRPSSMINGVVSGSSKWWRGWIRRRWQRVPQKVFPMIVNGCAGWQTNTVQRQSAEKAEIQGCWRACFDSIATKHYSLFNYLEVKYQIKFIIHVLKLDKDRIFNPALAHNIGNLLGVFFMASDNSRLVQRYSIWCLYVDRMWFRMIGLANMYWKRFL